MGSRTRREEEEEGEERRGQKAPISFLPSMR